MTTQPSVHHGIVDLDQHNKAHLPRAPRTVEETGLNFLFLVELLAKVLFLRGRLRLAELANHCKLPVAVLEPVLTFMRSERMCEITRSSETETTITYSLSELGRSRAHEFLQKSQYAGAAPVSLEAYVEQAHRQSVAHMHVIRDKVQEVFSGLVVREQILHQIGAAMNSGRAIFIYGPAGSGKTYIAERLAGLLSGNVVVPHAFTVDNEVILVFDPLVHQPLSMEKNSLGELDQGKGYDLRWVPCRRPVVLAGGELTLSMLDLDFDEAARFYHAPPQIKANNGLLIIDDLGRQLVPPQALLNRWIVPLDRRVDHLALHTGKKFMIPFDVTVVFSCNLPPSELADEAFLRRLGYKIFVGPLNEDEYRTVFQQVCAELSIQFSEQGLDYLTHEHHYREGKPLLACVPRDILRQVRDIARYNGIQPELSAELLDWAWNNYYAKDEQQFEHPK